MIKDFPLEMNNDDDITIYKRSKKNNNYLGNSFGFYYIYKQNNTPKK